MVTPKHVIVANAGDSRAILIMVPSRGVQRAAAAAANVPSRRRTIARGADGKGALTALSSSSAQGNGGGVDEEEEKDETAAAVAQRFASALGLSLDENNSSSSAGKAFGEEGVAITVDSPGEGGKSAIGGGLNDSVRLEELEEEEEEEERGGGNIEDLGLDEAETAKIRRLLSAMMMSSEGPAASSSAAAGAGAAGGGGVTARAGGDNRGAIGGDVGAGGGRKNTFKEKKTAGEKQIEVLALSRDHTAKDERERERVEAAGGRAFEVSYLEEDGTEAMASLGGRIKMKKKTLFSQVFFCGKEKDHRAKGIDMLILTWPFPRRGVCMFVYVC